MSFSSSVSGSVTAIKFFKGTGNTGTHTGSLWSASGQRLATVTFTGETASGWQRANLTTPVTLTAGTTYVVSYYAPVGHYAYTSDFFTTARTVGPLTAGVTTNGRFLYRTGGGFPTSSWRASNYFVDVVFSTATAPAPGHGHLHDPGQQRDRNRDEHECHGPAVRRRVRDRLAEPVAARPAPSREPPVTTRPPT